ncbi:JmjC domain-containing protein [Nocardia sp.]|uniref:JmjC domain-containing protein n=1 Tax=Nocardia sp. TaxID=1821 RepID=UPI00261A777F|nr:cupin domain-containing protein [Nocardia sp.]
MVIHGSSDKFAGLYSAADFRAGLHGTAYSYAVYRDHSGENKETDAVTPRTASALFDAGMSIVTVGADADNERLSAFITSAGKALGVTAGAFVNCHYSPDGHGLDWHFDATHVFILQIEGKKRWQFSRSPATPAPLFARDLETVRQPEFAAALGDGQKWEPPTGSDISERDLQPGNVFYMPPGTWHKASALGESLALTLSFYPISFTTLLSTAIHALALKDTEWRRDLEEFNPLDTGAIGSAAFASFLAGRLEEAAGVIRDMSAEDLVSAFNHVRATPPLRDLVRDSTLLTRVRSAQKSQGSVLKAR